MPPILLLHSYTRYEESSSGLFHWPFTFFTVNTTSCHFRFHNIDDETFLIQNHIILLLKSQRFIGRKYRFLSFKKILNEICKIKNLERRVVVNNRNKRKIFRKK